MAEQSRAGESETEGGRTAGAGRVGHDAAFGDGGRGEAGPTASVGRDGQSAEEDPEPDPEDELLELVEVSPDEVPPDEVSLDEDSPPDDADELLEAVSADDELSLRRLAALLPWSFL
mgnify:FL=1